MPKILSFKNEDVKYPPLKRFLDWFDNQDKFIKSTFVITILLIISTPVIVGAYLTFFQHAAEPVQEFSQGRKIVLGSYVGNNVNDYINWGKTIGKDNYFPPLVLLFNAFQGKASSFDDVKQDINGAIDNGGVPILTWMPWNYLQYDITPQDIIDGKQDTYIRKFADDIVTNNKKFIIRLGHEMNLNGESKYPWSADKGTDGPTYVKMYRHIVDILYHEHARQYVKLEWCPGNVRQQKLNKPFKDLTENEISQQHIQILNSYYPGDNYVDYLGFDSYDNLDNKYQMLELFQPTYDTINALPDQIHKNKPIIVTETNTGSADSPRTAQYTADWFSNGYPQVYNNMPRIKAIIPFRLSTSPQVLNAYRLLVKDSRFQGTADDLGFEQIPLPSSGPTDTPISTPTITPTPITTLSTKSIPASEDTYVSEAQPNTNFNKQVWLISGDSPKKLTYLKFIVPSVKVAEAKLVLTVGEGKFAASDATFNLKEITTNAWKESTLIYNTRPAAGNIFKKFKGAAKGAIIEINLTDYIKAKQGQTVSFSIGTTNSDWLTIRSSESDSKPTLIIKYQ